MLKEKELIADQKLSLLSEVVGIFSTQEAKLRVDTLRYHLGSLEDKFLKELYFFYDSGHLFYLYLSLIIGVKPAIYLSKDEYKQFGTKIIPHALREEFDFSASNSIIYHKQSIRKLVLEYKNYFPDFDFRKIDDDSYLKIYIGKRAGASNNSNQEDIKSGLIFGYPIDSVLSFCKPGTRNGMVSIDKFGFCISISKRDKAFFVPRIEQKYVQTGASDIVDNLVRGWKNDFAELVRNYESEIKVIKYSGLNFLLYTYQGGNGSLRCALVPLFSMKDELQAGKFLYLLRREIMKVSGIPRFGDDGGLWQMEYAQIAEHIIANNKKNIVDPNLLYCQVNISKNLSQKLIFSVISMSELRNFLQEINMLSKQIEEILKS